MIAVNQRQIALKMTRLFCFFYFVNLELFLRDKKYLTMLYPEMINGWTLEILLPG